MLEQLALVSFGQRAGFSLADIASMLTANGPDVDRKKLQAKADELDKTIKQLASMRDGLRHAANCPSPKHMDCPTFKKLLRISARPKFKVSRSI